MTAIYTTGILFFVGGLPTTEYTIINSSPYFFWTCLCVCRGLFWRTRRRLLSSVCCVLPAAEKLHMAFNLMKVLVDLTDLPVAAVVVCLRWWNDDALLIVVMDRASGRAWTLMFVIVDCFHVR